MVLTGGVDNNVPANIITDFGTALAVQIRFTARAAGAVGNGLKINVGSASLGFEALPTITDAPATNEVNVVLNATVGSQTTAEQLVNAVNASALVRAQILSAAGSQYSGLTPNAPALLTLTGGGSTKAAAHADFGTSLEILLTADTAGAAGEGIRVNVTKANLNATGVPNVIADVPNKTIAVVLNNRAGAHTSAEQLRAALDATTLVSAVTIPASQTSLTHGNLGTFTFTGGGNPISTLVLKGATAAQVISDFNAANPLGIRLTAKTAGTAGNGITINVTARPGDDLAGPAAASDRGQQHDNQCRIEQQCRQSDDGQELINAASRRKPRRFWRPPSCCTVRRRNPSAARPIIYTPLILGGVDDEIINPGYRALRNTTGNEVVYRFASTLPDDLYRVEVFGFDSAAQGITGLRNNSNDLFTPKNPGDDRDSIHFRLDLGAQVISVVPQPITRNLQQINRNGATGFFLRFGIQQTTAALSATSTASDVRAALEGLPNGLIQRGDVVVTGPVGGPWQVTFHGRLQLLSGVAVDRYGPGRDDFGAGPPVASHGPDAGLFQRRRTESRVCHQSLAVPGLQHPEHAPLDRRPAVGGQSGDVRRRRQPGGFDL